MNLPLLWSWSKNLQLEVGSACLSKPVEAHDKISFANHVSCVTIAWFGHAQSQASPLGNEHSKSEPPLKGWGHSIDKTPYCNSLGWSKYGTQFGKDIQYWSGYSSKEEPYAEVPLGNHVHVGNMQLQGSSSAGQVSYLVYSGPPLQHIVTFANFEVGMAIKPENVPAFIAGHHLPWSATIASARDMLPENALLGSKTPSGNVMVTDSISSLVPVSC